MPQRLYTVYQVANLLGAVPAEVIGWIDKGWLPCRRAANQPLRISERNLVAFLKNQGVNIEQVMAKAVINESRQTVPGAHSPVAAALMQQPADTRSTRRLPAQDRPFGDEPVTEPASTFDPAQSPTAQVADAAQAAEAILREAVARNASSIHIECPPEGLTLRMRVDGVVRSNVDSSMGISASMGSEVLGRFSEMAGLDAAPGAPPQQGRFSCAVNGRSITLRAATCPTTRGRKMVIHVADGRAAPPLSDLGMTEQQESELRELLAQPCGLIVLAGLPDGGAREALRAIAAELCTPDRSVAAIIRDGDDAIRGASCTQAGPQAGVSFDQAVRGVAAQDPDAIAIEEVLDPATASAALAAALDGCLVVARMGVPSAPHALDTLLKMGLEPWPLSLALRAVVTRVTVRRVCPRCTHRAPVLAGLVRRLGLQAEDIGVENCVGAGCAECRDSGYLGTTGVVSVMRASKSVAAARRAGGGLAALGRAAEQSGTGTLLQAGLAKASRGETSLQELQRVLGFAAERC